MGNHQNKTDTTDDDCFRVLLQNVQIKKLKAGTSTTIAKPPIQQFHQMIGTRNIPEYASFWNKITLVFFLKEISFLSACLFMIILTKDN